jgi:hypothetical protein
LATGPVNAITVAVSVLQTATSATVVTDGVGLTVIENVVVDPEHEFEKGSTVINAVTGVLPTLVAVKLAILPPPVNGLKPTLVVEVQVKTVDGNPLKVVIGITTPLHSTTVGTTATVGVGPTVMVNDIGVPKHVFDIGVTVIFAFIGNGLTLFIATNGAILLTPLEVIPMVVLLFVQL